MTPETEVPPEQQDDTPPQETEQPPTEAPAPGSSPPAGSTSNEYVRLLEQQLREQNRQIQELIDKQTTPTATPPARDVDTEKTTFYQDPTGSTRNIVREELQATVAPLLDFVKEMRGSNAYTDLKNRFKMNPQWATHFADPSLEAAVDQIMSKAEKNDTNMQAAIVHALGLKAIGQLPSAAGNGTPAPTPPTSQTAGERPVAPQPAHMRPSGTQPTQPRAPARRQLNELEKRMARERWPGDPKAEEKYLNWLELPADQVILANAEGKVEPKK